MTDSSNNKKEQQLIVRVRRLEWLGHVVRTDDYRDIFNILNYQRIRKQSPGRHHLEDHLTET